MENKKITIAYGDGIGPEIMECTLEILKNAGAKLTFETISIGEEQYKKGLSSGISPEAWQSVKENKILLKAPITTPQGKGYKSLNVTFRKTLGLFANIRPVCTYPFLQNTKTKYNMDMVIFRENEEDLYSGIEYRATKDTALSLKLITKQGSERIIRAAFEYAKNHGRKKVTCITKDNIMKISDGIFHNIFREISDQYPDIEKEHMIVDIGAARIAARPDLFDVVVTLNLYGDIISDIAAEISGSVGLAGSSNIGADYAMFEAIHGSAPDIAGLDIANPCGLINAACMMLEHIGHFDTSVLIKNAVIKTLEDGIHTQDLYDEKHSAELVSTKGFTKAVIKNLGLAPKMQTNIAQGKPFRLTQEIKGYQHTKKQVGVDCFIKPLARQNNIEQLAASIKNITTDTKLELENISEKGLAIWPNIVYEDFQSDFVRLRFIAKDQSASQTDIILLLTKLTEANFELVMTINLSTYDDMAGFTKAQGE